MNAVVTPAASPDFVVADLSQAGDQGYFVLDSKVYERWGQLCRVCATPIRRRVQGQRSSYDCPHCQRR